MTTDGLANEITSAHGRADEPILDTYSSELSKDSSRLFNNDIDNVDLLRLWRDRTVVPSHAVLTLQAD